MGVQLRPTGIKIIVVKNTKEVTDNGKVLIPPCLQLDTVAWHYDYLQHPGLTRLERKHSEQL